MHYIKGKYKSSIYESETGYKVGLFRVIETNHEDIEVNKTITFTGHFAELIKDVSYIFEGELIFHDRYGSQFQTIKYEKIAPEEKEAILEFLTSSFIKGCGKVTAKRIVDMFGNKALSKIKENKQNLLLIPKISEKTATSIYNSVIKYYESDEDIIYLQNLGFTIKETMNLINIYDKGIKSIINDNIYLLIDIIEFHKLDKIFLTTNSNEDKRRVEACILEAMKILTFHTGDIYLDKIEIVEYLSKYYKIYLKLDEFLNKLYLDKKIIIEKEDYYLIDDYLDESNIALNISKLIKKKNLKLSNFDENLSLIMKNTNTLYNDEQILAIRKALENKISIITGGPGTGKTTIINGIIKLYTKINNISNSEIDKFILLIAPTGRAAKRMADATGIPASTIHRFLKWDKERNVFGVNEFNKLHYDLIIVDEASMIDNRLLSSLFKGIDLNTQIVFVGDEYQLPSVGPGLILNDMINSKKITHTKLEYIYRQSNNSFIPILAKQIKDVSISNEVLTKKDDYNFIVSSNEGIKNVVKQILEKSKSKDINETKLQVLAPMYKGENGIDNLNILLQSVFNPKKNQKELVFFNIKYREGDKILNLVNDLDSNIYNGDMGFIQEINLESKTDLLVVNYDGNVISYKREDLNTITHAYAISIHKSQGSEFDHVIIPITFGYSKMLYNKLIYTGVSRAKKSLVLIGNIDAFNAAVKNNYSEIRKTTLKQKILHNLKSNG
ncbi:MAG: ATP-dependent RecD-like DNA helicase [Bacilli bacterium]|nr:ATP-dependent RecD-like DNA helicase [Bacilli bacterium]